VLPALLYAQINRMGDLHGDLRDRRDQLGGNFLKPILMSRAGNLSMLLVVLRSIRGSRFAFGFIGPSSGPALLAVGWNLPRRGWIRPQIVGESR
jgi:predicted PurR-regulated permease PerM